MFARSPPLPVGRYLAGAVPKTRSAPFVGLASHKPSEFELLYMHGNFRDSD